MLDHGGWGRADIVVLKPPAELADVVEFFWVDEWSPRRRPARQYRIVADDAPHILWHLQGVRHRHESLALVGARSTYRDIDVSARLLTVGVRLRPGVLPTLTGAAAHHLTDRGAPLQRRLRRTALASAECAIDELTEFLGDHATRHRTHRFSARVQSLDPCGRHGVSDIARELGITERSLRNLSHAQLGLSLKRFMMIRRLHGALALASSATSVNWSRVAGEAGYSDQAHLIRDCRALLGETPATFLRRANDACADVDPSLRSG